MIASDIFVYMDYNIDEELISLIKNMRIDLVM
jgi:hypothetical protein